jgi:hypothetical protein
LYFVYRHGFGKYTTARGMCHIGEWSEGLREGRAIQRSVIKLASGSIARDYFVEFAGTNPVLSGFPFFMSKRKNRSNFKTETFNFCSTYEFHVIL